MVPFTFVAKMLFLNACYICVEAATLNNVSGTLSTRRAGNAIFTALEQSQEAIEITSEDQVIQVSF